MKMIDVGAKAKTERVAVARGFVSMSGETRARIERGDVEKGDVLAAARLAGIMAAKRTPDLVPLCHPIALSAVDVLADPTPGGVEVTATVRTVATISTPPGPGVASTSTPESAMGWQSGTRSGVRFAAMIPASRAAARTSPFSTSPRRMRPTVAADIATNPRATAIRSVFGFAPTSIIFMGVSGARRLQPTGFRLQEKRCVVSPGACSL